MGVGIQATARFGPTRSWIMEPWRRSTQVRTTARFMANMATAKPMATNLMAKTAMSFMSLAPRRRAGRGWRHGLDRTLAHGAQLRRLLPRQIQAEQLGQLLHPAVGGA